MVPLCAKTQRPLRNGWGILDGDCPDGALSNVGYEDLALGACRDLAKDRFCWAVEACL